ncbi:hypothetical protein F5Y16DRAFT_366818 [Xylariaceae sp. FL0255]|nr:hypothetical protein F5Y16DRAFT_366818 [Xylariaceae sp. FL0255]
MCRLLVAVTNITQQKVNEAELTIDGIQVTGTEPNSYTMSIQATIKADSSIKATVDGFNGTMWLADTNPPLAFASINFPQTDTSAVQQVNVTQDVQISDAAAFTTFNEYLLTNKSITVWVLGKTHVHVSGISHAYGVDFNKTVILTGLDGFAGLSVTNPKISLAETNNFNGTTNIPNPSILTLDIGNVTFTNFLNGSAIGTTQINDLVFKPGNNSFFTTATISQLPVLEALTAEPLCKLDGKLPFVLTGKNVTNNGQVIPYFRDALASANQSVTIDLSKAAPAAGIPIGCTNSSSSSEDNDEPMTNVGN